MGFGSSKSFSSVSESSRSSRSRSSHASSISNDSSLSTSNGSASSQSINACGGNKCWMIWIAVWHCETDKATGETSSMWLPVNEYDYGCHNSNPYPEYGVNTWTRDPANSGIYYDGEDYCVYECGYFYVKQLEPADLSTDQPLCADPSELPDDPCNCRVPDGGYPDLPFGGDPPDDCDCSPCSKSSSSSSNSSPSSNSSSSGEPLCDNWLCYYDCSEGSFGTPILTDESIPCASVTWPSEQGVWQVEPDAANEDVCAYRILLPAGSPAPSAPTDHDDCECPLPMVELSCCGTTVMMPRYWACTSVGARYAYFPGGCGDYKSFVADLARSTPQCSDTLNFSNGYCDVPDSCASYFNCSVSTARISVNFSIGSGKVRISISRSDATPMGTWEADITDCDDSYVLNPQVVFGFTNASGSWIVSPTGGP
jgi:hypothetical protein